MTDDLPFLKLALESEKTLDRLLKCQSKGHLDHVVMITSYEHLNGWEVKVRCLGCEKARGAFIRAIENDGELYFIDGFNDQQLMKFTESIFLNYVPLYSKEW